MKLFRVLALGLLLFSGIRVFAGPDEEYVRIYGIIGRGDALRESGDSAGAVAAYSEAQNALVRFNSTYSGWNEKVVNYRLNYLSDQISKLSYRAGGNSKTNPKPAPSPANSPAPAPAPPHIATAPLAPSVPGEAEKKAAAIEEMNRQLQGQVSGLSEQVKSLRDDKTTLEAKLREAFSAQSSTAASAEMSRAMETVRNLQKENDLLKAALAQATNHPAATSAEALAKVQRQLSEATARIESLTRSNLFLQQEQRVLLAKLDAHTIPETAIEAMRAENEILKKQVAEMKGKAPSNSPKVNEQQNLEQAEAEVALLRSEKETLRTEKMALEQKIQLLSAAPNAAAPVVAAPAPAPAVPDSVSAGKIASLQNQRDQLQKTIDEIARESSGRKKGKALASRLDEMSGEIAGLKATIEILESKPIPYTREELALMSSPSSTGMVAVHRSGDHPKRAHSEKVKALMVEARKHYDTGDYEKAAQVFSEALKLEPGNFEILALLASSQLEHGNLVDAEKTVKLALQSEPQDVFSLYILGQVKFQQKNYDDALDALGKAAHLLPDHANIENYIGLALSEKGLRTQAEAAFRTALQLDPDFAEAHMNLAVVYATQTPPLVELARWHYEKAMQIGHPPNTKLEDLIKSAANSRAAASASRP